MRFWPRSLPARIALALVAAGTAITWLDFAVQASDRASPTRGELPTAIAPFEVERIALSPVSGPILLAVHLSSIEPGVAPVVQVLADGGLALRRPLPLARSPGGSAQSARGAAIVLPAASIQDLDARARSAFVEAMAALVPERPVPANRFRTVDFTLPVAEFERLLSWVR